MLDEKDLRIPPAQNDPDGPARLSPGLLEDWLKREVFRRTLALASTAHELKTPLAVMAGYTDLLLREGLGPLTEGQKNVLIEMQQNATRLQRFIQGFLSFSALESGKFEISKELGDVNQCVAEVIRLWEVPFAQRQMSCEFQPDANLRQAFCDFPKLQHIVSNLLDNASKFAPAGGHVKVRTENYFWERRGIHKNLLVFHGERRNPERRSGVNAIRIAVTDNGPGIPAEYQQEIFNEFVRLHKTSQPGGMGLGLAIVRRLVEAHAGKVWVESEVGHGSTFSVLIPAVSGRED